MTSTPGDMERHLSEEDRDAAVGRLQDAFAEGHLTHQEMDERLQTALKAATHGELAPALDRLPDTDAGRTVEVKAMSGRIKRQGAWQVPRVLRIHNGFGGADLDLSRAVIEHPTIDIELQLDFGSAKIVLPRDATVDIDGLVSDWKQPDYKAPRRGASGRPHVRVTGHLGHGRLKIRHRR